MSMENSTLFSVNDVDSGDTTVRIDGDAVDSHNARTIDDPPNSSEAGRRHSSGIPQGSARNTSSDNGAYNSHHGVLRTHSEPTGAFGNPPTGVVNQTSCARCPDLPGASVVTVEPSPRSGEDNSSARMAREDEDIPSDTDGEYQMRMSPAEPELQYPRSPGIEQFVEVNIDDVASMEDSAEDSTARGSNGSAGSSQPSDVRVGADTSHDIEEHSQPSSHPNGPSSLTINCESSDLSGHVNRVFNEEESQEAVSPPPGYYSSIVQEFEYRDEPPRYEQEQPIDADSVGQLEMPDQAGSTSNGDVIIRAGDEHPSVNALDEYSGTYSLFTAYMLCLFGGFLGLHHLYLGRRNFAVMYACTFGLFGLGWFVDLVRLERLVSQCNKDIAEDLANGYGYYAEPYGKLKDISIHDAFIWWLPPLGLLGWHHYALGGRTRYAMIHTATLGCFGIGWVIDLIRLPSLVRRRNEAVRRLRNRGSLSVNPGDYVEYYDVFILCAVTGFLGLHYLYLKQTRRFYLFVCTFGLVGFGWLRDMCGGFESLVDNKKREIRDPSQPAEYVEPFVVPVDDSGAPLWEQRSAWIPNPAF